MRATFFFMAIFLSCLFSGCKEEKEIPSDGPLFFTSVSHEFRLLDGEGMNIVEDISYNPNYNSSDVYQVNSSMYTVRSVEYPGDESSFTFKVSLTDNPTFILKHHGDEKLFAELPPETLTYVMKSLRIFGDEEEHTLVFHSQWSNEKGYVCYQIDLDGETFGAGDDGIVEVVVRK